MGSRRPPLAAGGRAGAQVAGPAERANGCERSSRRLQEDWRTAEARSPTWDSCSGIGGKARRRLVASDSRRRAHRTSRGATCTQESGRCYALMHDTQPCAHGITGAACSGSDSAESLCVPHGQNVPSNTACLRARTREGACVPACLHGCVCACVRVCLRGCGSAR
jgi:hypothetical protein